jgi:hypothetical protein
VQKWARQYPLEKLVDENRGIVKIANFFPPSVAEYLHHVLIEMPEDQWVDTLSERNYAENRIAHRFFSIKHHPVVQAVARTLGLLAPIHFNTFSAAKYLNEHHIETHDDEAPASVQMDDGSVLACRRDVAIIVYLSKNWTAAEGGILHDVQRDEEHVPTFNTAIAFRVPRLHAVTPVLGSRPRLSFFGWYLRPVDPDVAATLGFPALSLSLAVPPAIEAAPLGASGSGSGSGKDAKKSLTEEREPKRCGSGTEGGRPKRSGSGTEGGRHKRKAHKRNDAETHAREETGAVKHAHAGCADGLDHAHAIGRLVNRLMMRRERAGK